MLQSLKQIKNRIRSVENTSKVTHAMEMISIAKLRQSETRLPAQRTYSDKVERLLNNLLSNTKGITNSFIVGRAQVKKIALCVITSDTGLCSVYNNNIIRLSESFINEHGRDKILLITVGRKGFNYFRRKGFDIAEKFIEANGRYSEELSKQLLDLLMRFFLTGQADEVYIAYTNYITISKHKQIIEKIFNLGKREEKNEIEYNFEPDINKILDKLIPLYLVNKIKSILLNSFSCEHAARMIAMAEATNNAKDLLDGLVLTRNKVRQANITKEILEIVSTAEAVR